jgi:hypothetical protein
MHRLLYLTLFQLQPPLQPLLLFLTLLLMILPLLLLMLLWLAEPPLLSLACCESSAYEGPRHIRKQQQLHCQNSRLHHPPYPNHYCYCSPLSLAIVLHRPYS